MPDTYTSQFSGEEIDSALRAAQVISGASTPAELRDKLEIRGDTIPVSATDPTPVSEALTASGGGVNPNLLDNWYFGRPVNQRGQMEYPSSNGLSYTIDRWTQNSSGVKINDGYITVGGAGGIFERIENIDLLVGKLLTFSVLTTDGLYTGTTTFSKEDHVFSSADNLLILYNKYFNAFQIAPSVAGATKNLLAAKLELGDQQTLAHKENGVWVLNEVPDYGEQLARCQRCAFSPLFEAYATAVICNLFVSSAANGIAFGEVTLPVSMRSKPVFSGNASKFWIVAENGGGASHPTAIAVMGLSADKVMIQVNGSYTANTQYILYVENPFTSADFLLSADL